MPSNRSIHVTPTTMDHELNVAREVALSKKLQAMLLEIAKQQVHVDTNALDRYHGFENPTVFFYNLVVTLPMRLG